MKNQSRPDKLQRPQRLSYQKGASRLLPAPAFSFLHSSLIPPFRFSFSTSFFPSSNHFISPSCCPSFLFFIPYFTSFFISIRFHSSLLQSFLPFPYYWKWIFPMNRSVCRSVDWLVGLLVCHNFQFHFPRSYRSICLLSIQPSCSSLILPSVLPAINPRPLRSLLSYYPLAVLPSFLILTLLPSYINLSVTLLKDSVHDRIECVFCPCFMFYYD